MFSIKMFLLNVSFILNRAIFNFGFLICHVTPVHLVLWVDPLHLPSLGGIGLAEEDI